MILFVCWLVGFFLINLFCFGVPFTNIQNNTQCSSRQCPSPIHPHPPPSSPSTTHSSFPRVKSLYVLSPFLIFPTHFFSLPLYSLSQLFIFPKWMRTIPFSNLHWIKLYLFFQPESIVFSYLYITKHPI